MFLNVMKRGCLNVLDRTLVLNVLPNVCTCARSNLHSARFNTTAVFVCFVACSFMHPLYHPVLFSFLVFYVPTRILYTQSAPKHSGVYFNHNLHTTITYQKTDTLARKTQSSPSTMRKSSLLRHRCYTSSRWRARKTSCLRVLCAPKYYLIKKQ